MRAGLETLAAVVLLSLGTVGASGPATPVLAADAEARSSPLYSADGVFVRHLRIRVRPGSTSDYEALLERCVEVADAAELDFDWLSYREPPGRYWLLLFSDTREGFATPPTLSGFVDRIAAAADAETGRDLRDRLDKIPYETESEVVYRQKSEWSTVRSMYTATHPKARMIDRTIRPGMERDFDLALTARTRFFAERGYPLPVEGFVTIEGAPGRALQVVFPTDWPAFHEAESFHAFSLTLDEAGQAEYAERKDALLATMDGAEYYDGDYVAEMSYGGI